MIPRRPALLFSFVLLATGLSCRAVPFLPYATSAAPRSSAPAKTGTTSGSTAPPQASVPAPPRPKPEGKPLTDGIARAKARSDAAPRNRDLVFALAMDIMNYRVSSGDYRAPGPEWAVVAKAAAARIDDLSRDTSALTRGQQIGALSTRGTLIGFAGRFSEGRALLEKALEMNPKDLWNAREILYIDRMTKDAAASEALCKRVRKAIGGQPKKEFEHDLRELLVSCTGQHPDNASGEVEAATFKKFVPWAAGPDAKWFWTHLVTKECIDESHSCWNSCSGCLGGCREHPLDTKWTRDCKHACGLCHEGCNEREHECIAKAKAKAKGTES